MSQLVRIQKFIADCGHCSRRKAEEKLLQGKIKLNGKIVRELGTKVDPREDVIEVEGSIMHREGVEKIYLVMNKPRGVVSTVHDPEGRPTVMDICRNVSERIYPVGRLDYFSEGLLLLTNDGDLTNKILHPSHNVEKVYEVKVFGLVAPKVVQKLRSKRVFPEGSVEPTSVRVIKQLPNKTWLEFRLNEGRNREIRRICEEEGLVIDKLRRVSIEGLSIEGIRPGTYQYITKRELLTKLNFDRDGSKREVSPTYKSSKKTISWKKSKRMPGKRSDDRSFKGFKKENYYTTIESIKNPPVAKPQESKSERTPSSTSAS